MWLNIQFKFNCTFIKLLNYILESLKPFCLIATFPKLFSHSVLWQQLWKKFLSRRSNGPKESVIHLSGSQKANPEFTGNGSNTKLRNRELQLESCSNDVTNIHYCWTSPLQLYASTKIQSGRKQPCQDTVLTLELQTNNVSFGDRFSLFFIVFIELYIFLQVIF